MSDSDAALRARQYYQQGVAFFQRGALSEADVALRRAIQTAPDHMDARVQLARVLLRRGRPNDGLRVIDAGLARNSLTDEERARLLEQAARCASTAGQYDTARSYLEQALSLGKSRSKQVLNNVAAVCCKGGEFETGFEYFLVAAGKPDPA